MKAVLFDLDGTLIDSLPIIMQSARLTLDGLNAGHISDQQIRDLIGVPLVETGEILLGAGKGQLYRDCYQEHFWSLNFSDWQPFAGIIAMLDALKAQNTKMAVITAKRQAPAEKTLEQAGLAAYFDLVLGVEKCPKPKPDPAPALIALAEFKVVADQAAFVGDSIFDIGCGKAAGLFSVGVSWGAAKPYDLQQAGADIIARDTAHLKDILLAK